MEVLRVRDVAETEKAEREITKGREKEDCGFKRKRGQGKKNERGRMEVAVGDK